MSVCFLYRKLLLPILVITIIFMLECVHQVCSEDVRKATGYNGDKVVLKLDIDKTWKLTEIEWSIYENVTVIAAFRANRPFLKFKDRLELNTTSGDLTIKNVTGKDALKYKVYLQNTEGINNIIYIQLSVQEKVRKPNITLLHRVLDAEKCVISLKCSSLSSKISLSWKLEPGLTEHFCSDSPAVARESVMWTSLKTNRDIIFTCIATDGTHNESSQWSGKCKDSVEKLNNCSQVCVNKSSACAGRGIGALTVLLTLVALGIGCCFQLNGSNLSKFFQTCFQMIRRKDNKEDKATSTEDKLGEDKTSEPESKEVNKQDDKPPDSKLDSPKDFSDSDSQSQCTSAITNETEVDMQYEQSVQSSDNGEYVKDIQHSSSDSTDNNKGSVGELI